MAYLRWSEECPWYVFENTEHNFEICGEGVFTLQEIKSEKESILQKMSVRPGWKRNPTDEEMAMLREAMDCWVEWMENPERSP